MKGLPSLFPSPKRTPIARHNQFFVSLSALGGQKILSSVAPRLLHSVHFLPALRASLWRRPHVIPALDAQPLFPPIHLLENRNHPPLPQQMSQPIPVAIQVAGRNKDHSGDRYGAHALILSAFTPRIPFCLHFLTHNRTPFQKFQFTPPSPQPMNEKQGRPFIGHCTHPWDSSSSCFSSRSSS